MTSPTQATPKQIAIAPATPTVAEPITTVAEQITVYREFVANFAKDNPPSTFLCLGAGSFALLGLTEFALPLIETISIALFATGGIASIGFAAFKWNRTRPDMTGHDRT